MDPISAGIGAIGLGMQIFGTMKASSAASQAANISSNIAGLEGQVNDQKHQAMLLSSRRQQMEVIRNNQLARSMALNSATNQGAQMGSGLSGGLSQIAGQSGVNMMGINKNLEIGNNIFGIDQKISANKAQLAQVQGSMASAQGIASLGGSLAKAGGPMSSLFGQFGALGGGGASPLPTGGYGVTGGNSSSDYIG